MADEGFRPSPAVGLFRQVLLEFEDGRRAAGLRRQCPERVAHPAGVLGPLEEPKSVFEAPLDDRSGLRTKGAGAGAKKGNRTRNRNDDGTHGNGSLDPPKAERYRPA